MNGDLTIDQAIAGLLLRSKITDDTVEELACVQSVKAMKAIVKRLNVVKFSPGAADLSKGPTLRGNAPLRLSTALTKIREELAQCLTQREMLGEGKLTEDPKAKVALNRKIARLKARDYWLRKMAFSCGFARTIMDETKGGAEQDYLVAEINREPDGD